MHEFNALLDGYKWRHERQEEFAAYFVSGLMNISGKSLKRNLSPGDLIKPLRQTAKQQNKRKEAEYLREKFNLQGGD